MHFLLYVMTSLSSGAGFPIGTIYIIDYIIRLGSIPLPAVVSVMIDIILHCHSLLSSIQKFDFIHRNRRNNTIVCMRFNIFMEKVNLDCIAKTFATLSHASAVTDLWRI